MTDRAIRRAVPLGEQVADQLRARIIRAEIAPGTRLIEESIAAEYEVSRGPVRDALQRLALEDLVDYSHKPGAFVIGLGIGDVEQLYSLRGALEALAVERTVARRDTVVWTVLEEALEAMFDAAKTSDAQRFAVADLAFHSGIYDIAEHPRLKTMWNQVKPIFAGLLDVTIDFAHDYLDSARDHERLLGMLRKGTAAAAVKELRAHLRDAEERMVQEIKVRQTD